MKKAFLVPLLATSLLLGCNSKNNVLTTLEILEKASEFGALLVNGSSGVAYSDRDIDIKLVPNEYLIGLRSVIVRDVVIEKDGEKIDVKVAVLFTINEESSSLWKITEKRPDENHDRFIPSYPGANEPDYYSSLTANLRLFYEEDEPVIDDTELQVSWNVYHRPKRN